MARLALVLPAALAGTVALQVVTWALAMRWHRLKLVDITWGPGFAVVAAVAWMATIGGDGDPLRRALLLALTVLWGARLAVHIGLRQRGDATEDPRYEELMSRRTGDPRWIALRSVFLLQAVAAWFISFPVQFGMVAGGAAGPLTVLGVLVWLVGFFFETVGDLQLQRFVADPASRGRVLDSGLWRYTRHPNYFGDACVWWGLYLIGADGGPAAALTVVSPLLMTWFLAAKTGKPLLEKRLAVTRPGYAEYIARTSGFVPLPPRRPSA